MAALTGFVLLLAATTAGFAVCSFYFLDIDGHWNSIVSKTWDNSAIIIAIFTAVWILYAALRYICAKNQTLTITNNKREDQVGHLIVPGRSTKEMINLLRQVRDPGQVPPLYPNGWYEVMRSEDLPIGKVNGTFIVGKHMVVFRNEKGKVCILDAYCPHMGANLGVGGIVKGGCLKCPFHGWEFDGETGKCTNIPYADKVPAFAKTNVWTAIERNGIIFVWFDAEGREPPYTLEDIPQIVTKKWRYVGCSVHSVNAHVQDLVENGADVAHFKMIHGMAIGGGSSVDFRDFNTNWLNSFLMVNLKINWEVLPAPNDHIGHTTIDSYYSLFKKWKLPFRIHADLRQVGPGYVFTVLQLPFGKGGFIQSFVPEGPMMVKMTSHLYFDWWAPKFIGDHVLRELATQIDRDCMIWNNKTYPSKPLLLKEEEGISKFRRWFSQFYSENSPKLNIRNGLDSLTW